MPTAETPHWRLHRPRRKKWVRVLRTLVIAAILCVTILVMMAWFEESLIFFPDPYPSGQWDVEQVARGSGTTITDCDFFASDGTRLHGWLCQPAGAGPPAAPTSGMVLLWFHGNAGNIAHRAEIMQILAGLPAQVFIIDYRGYGRSDGKPSEQGLYRDGRAAWRFLTEDRRVDPQRIVIYGVSLGASVAVDLASKVRPGGLIVQSGFTSVPDMARLYYPFVPRWAIRTKLDSTVKIGRARCPIMVAHSPADEVIPFEHGRRLYENARGDKRFFEIPGAGHNETWIIGREAYLNELRRFLVHCAEVAATTR